MRVRGGRSDPRSTRAEGHTGSGDPTSPPGEGRGSGRRVPVLVASPQGDRDGDGERQSRDDDEGEGEVEGDHDATASFLMACPTVRPLLSMSGRSTSMFSS